MRERDRNASPKVEENPALPNRERGHPKSSGELRPGRPSTPIPESRVAEAQLTRVHAEICRFVAFSLTDFVSCGVARIFFSRATSPKNAASGFFPLGMFHRNLIAFLALFFSTASAAAAFQSPCGPFRGPPAARTHGFPAATPHVGQATEDCCLSVGCFVFISCFHRSRAWFGSAVVWWRKPGPSGRVYVLLTDIGRFSRNATTRALFICKPPL